MAWTDYATIGPHDSVASVEGRLLRDRFLVVKDGDDYVGLLTVSDTVAKPHTLAVDCIRAKPDSDYSESLEEVLRKTRW